MSYDGGFGNNDFSYLSLKKDHQNRPIWACGDGHIFLETSSPFFHQAYDFLIAVAEPVCRPKYIHEYKITSYSLYAAVSVGLTYEDIISALVKLSKNEICESLKSEIFSETAKCGKIKLVLKNSRYFLESLTAVHLAELISFQEIARSLVDSSTTLKNSQTLSRHSNQILVEKKPVYCSHRSKKAAFKGGKNAPRTEKVSVFSVEIDPEKSETVKKCCRDVGFPSLEEYDFRIDSIALSLDIKLKTDTNVRPYQKKSLSRMFGNGRARSGIIVLPCGAGKTLVGISAICTVAKSTIVFATTGVSCQQWKEQFIKWVDFSQYETPPINLFISSQKEPIPRDKPCIVITTYSMIAFTQRRSKAAETVMKEIRSREWGLVVLDEVHVAPAEMFRKCLNISKSMCKLGLTATLVREDEKIEDLFFLIGPKLYEADWIGLQKDRYLATVECIEIWCPMAPAFYREYIKHPSSNRKNLLQTMNPIKFQNCQHLINYHEARGDKIMVFSDNIYSLKKYAVLLGKPFIYGKTSDAERLLTLEALLKNPEMNTIFISKIGDTSIDLPDVNVVVQISSHFSSRRQEAQRLGRILRPKSRSDSGAYFYTLVSQDTDESFYAAKRQRFLVDQGYSFRVKKSLVSPGGIDSSSLMFSTLESQRELLDEVMGAAETFGVIESDEEKLQEAPKSSAVKGKEKKGTQNKISKAKRSKTGIVSRKLKNLKSSFLRFEKRRREELNLKD